MTGLAPEIAAWLVSNGLPDPVRIKTVPSATAAVMLLIDDHVLRWYGDGRSFDDGPDLVRHEAAALTALADTAVPAPRLVAWSSEPAAILSTIVPGEPHMELPDPGAARAVLERIHAVDPALLVPWTYRGYHEDCDLRRPAWWHSPAVWERAVRQTETARPVAEPVVIHRDFHPGNMLWLGGRLSGVVDWVDACLGPAAFDLAHLRVNLAVLHGIGAEDVLGDGDPAWDIEAAFGYLDWPTVEAIDAWPGPWPHLRPDIARDRLEGFMARSLARLG